MSLQEELENELNNQGADIVRFVDISKLSKEQNKGYFNAILFGITLTPEFIQNITNRPYYLQEMSLNNPNWEHEFHIKEAKTEKLADFIANILTSKGHSTYSQSINNIYSSGFFDVKNKITPLPHKTIATLAGLGWIGKHNLLVNQDFGSAISMCTVLTNAPLKTVLHSPQISQCGNCNVCKNICPEKAIKGKNWKIEIPRDERLDVHACTPCLKCLVLCPWTQKYMRRNVD